VNDRLVAENAGCEDTEDDASVFALGSSREVLRPARVNVETSSWVNALSPPRSLYVLCRWLCARGCKWMPKLMGWSS